MKAKHLFVALFSLLFLAAFEIGDYVELEHYLNGRSSANFERATKNIIMQIPKGSTGKVLASKKFPSGNIGVQVELMSHKPGTKTWIYYTPKKPNLSFYKEDPRGKEKKEKIAEVEQAKFTQTEKPVRGYSPETDQLDIKQVTEVQKKLKDVGNVTGESQEKCAECEKISSGEPAITSTCEKKNETVGVLKIYQDFENGRCDVSLAPANGDDKGRRYQFYGDGHFESVDSVGVRGYFFFPRKNQIAYKMSDDKKSITVQTASDVQITYSTETGRVSGVTGVKSWEEFPVNYEENHPRDKEHLKLTPSSAGTILDLQYIVGGFPERKKGGMAVMLNPSGKHCQIANTTLFNYTYDDGILDKVDFKFKTDAEFKAAVKKKDSKCEL